MLKWPSVGTVQVLMAQVLMVQVLIGAHRDSYYLRFFFTKLQMTSHLLQLCTQSEKEALSY